MILIVGGIAQGKLEYVKRVLEVDETQISWDAEAACFTKVFAGCSDWVRRCLAERKDPDAEMNELLRQNPEVVLIFDEVGCGVVPIQPEERIWRECVGRMTCRIAKSAKRVERILCGIPLVLKGEGQWK